MPAHRPFDQNMITTLDQLSRELSADAKPLGDRPGLPLPGGDPALLKAAADAATLLSRLLTAILAFDHSQDRAAEDLINSTAVLIHGVRSNTGV